MISSVPPPKSRLALLGPGGTGADPASPANRTSTARRLHAIGSNAVADRIGRLATDDVPTCLQEGAA